MDRKTENILQRINKGLPSSLARHITKIVVDKSEEELAHAALAAKHISRNKKEKIRRLLAAGKFRRSEEVVNEEVVGEIDKYHTERIRRARAAGLLPDPMSDPFYRKRMERIARGDFKKADPLSKIEIANARRLLAQPPKKK